MKVFDYIGLASSALGLVISFTALSVANEANGISKFVAKKSTDPFLIYEMVNIPNTDPERHELELRVHNVGLGPAVILGFEAYKHDQLVSGHAPVNGHDLAASFGFGEQATSRDELRYGQVIPANERATIFKVTVWRRPMPSDRFLELVTKGEFEHRLVVCYRSIYPDRYFAAVGSKDQVPASSCASPEYFTHRPPMPDPMRIELSPPIQQASLTELPR